MVRLVFIDMDDTFVGPDKTIPRDNLRILDVAAERGVQFVPCTGRSLRGVPRELVTHPSVRHAVCGGGALVYDVRSGEIIREVPIAKELVRSLYEDVRDQRVTFDLFTPEGVFASREHLPLYNQIEMTEATRRMVVSQRTFVDCDTEELIERTPTICRVNVLFGDERGRRVTWDAVEARPELFGASSIPMNVEVTSVEATKGTALVWLCERLGVDVADTVAFGDSGNDVAMLDVAGDSVAMENASPEVKAHARHVAPRCELAGVARYLEPLLG